MASRSEASRRAKKPSGDRGIRNRMHALGLGLICAAFFSGHARATVPAVKRAGSDTRTASTAKPYPVPRDPRDSISLPGRIQARYRAEEFRKVRSIRFTARERLDGEETVRHWIWFPAADSVSFHGPDPKGIPLQAGYNRKNKWSLSSETVAGIDRLFARDQLNLLFPVLFSRERVPAYQAGAGGWLVITYPMEDAEGGKTYEVLADSAGVIRAWKAPGSVTGAAGTRFEWSPPVNVDGLPLSLARSGPGGSGTRFTEVKVEGIRP